MVASHCLTGLLLQGLNDSIKQHISGVPCSPLSEEAITLLSQQHHVPEPVISSLSQFLQKVRLQLQTIVLVSQHLAKYRVQDITWPNARYFYLLMTSFTQYARVSCTRMCMLLTCARPI